MKPWNEMTGDEMAAAIQKSVDTYRRNTSGVPPDMIVPATLEAVMFWMDKTEEEAQEILDALEDEEYK